MTTPKKPAGDGGMDKLFSQLRQSTASAEGLGAALHVPKKPSIWRRFRSAVTGLFVSKKYAEANPDTTVSERVK